VRNLKFVEIIVALFALGLSIFTFWRQETYPYQQTIFAERLSAVADLNAATEETLARGLVAAQSAPDSVEHQALGEALPRFFSAAKRVEILMPRALSVERRALRSAVDGFLNAIRANDPGATQEAARNVVTVQAEFENAFSAAFVDRYEE